MQAPDLYSLLGMLKPLDAIRTTITEVKKTTEFCQTSPCQAHHNVRSLLTSPNWHLSVLLKAYIAVLVSEVLVFSRDTPSEVILDLCHVCKIIIHTKGDARYSERVIEDLCGTTQENLLSDFPLATLTSAQHYYDHANSGIQGAITYCTFEKPALVGPCQTYLVTVTQG